MNEPKERVKYLNVFDRTNSYCVLAVRRCWPFLSDMGVPIMMARTPTPLIETARSYMENDERISASAQDYPTYAQAVAEGWDRSARQLGALYGQSAEREFRAWANRNFIGEQQPTTWFIWSIILPILADAYGQGALSSSPLAPAQMHRFETLVRSRFGTIILEQDYIRFEQVREIPLDEAEQRWLAIELDDEPDAPREQDILLSVQLVMYRDRAYQTWQYLATWLDQPTRELFLAWTREVVAARSMPPALIQLPEV